MKSVPQQANLEETLSYVLEERAKEVARETGCVQREVKFSGATLLQTVVLGWLQHPNASLESLASTAEIRAVSVTDTAIHKRFTPQCAQFLHRMLEELCQVAVLADQDVPLALLRRFRLVVIEDSSSIALPDELAEHWRGCGGNQAHTAAAVKLHVRWDLKQGGLQGPLLTDVGRPINAVRCVRKASLLECSTSLMKAIAVWNGSKSRKAFFSPARTRGCVSWIGKVVRNWIWSTLVPRSVMARGKGRCWWAKPPNCQPVC